MRGIRLTIAVFALASGLVYVVALNSSSGGSSAGNGSNGSTSTAPAASSPRIQHVVIIFQENRTPDNLFHGLPNADIANTGVNSSGQTIVLQPTSLVGSYDLGHKHSDFVSMYDYQKYPHTSNLHSNTHSATARSRLSRDRVFQRTSSWFRAHPLPPRQAISLRRRIFVVAQVVPHRAARGFG